ncbi:hypothetical protein CMEL01_11646 [Colletotrichum melonis]|uniref:Uncharacterized protein n=1 Tax=Colletotrichum melonis TaxID=1209925 RepID=A0AAI9XVR3_9PEZI|nr:hypothetical protein CMEL01_11646 [Colletotrichum melonis]
MSSGNRYSAPTPLQATPQLASELLCWNFAARVLCGQETLDGQSPSQCFRDAGTFDCLVFGIWPLSTDSATSTIGYQALERLSGQVTGQNLDCHQTRPDRLLESIPIALCRRLPISEAALRRRASRVGQVGRFQNMAGRKTGRKAKKRHEKIRGKAT